ncbi:MAG: SH3 domain-containing protein [Gemmatimonadota bacterium]
MLAFAGLVSAAWFANRGDEEAPPAELVSVPKETSSAVLTTRVDSGVDFHTPVFAGIEDTASDFTATPPPASVEASNASTDAAPVPFQGPGVDPSEPSPPSLLGAAEVVVPRAVAPKRTPVRSAGSVRWIRATARRWVTVRASPAHGSRIVASVGPDTRVQLGESRGDWRRIRMKGVSGWVERAKF